MLGNLGYKCLSASIVPCGWGISGLLVYRQALESTELLESDM